VKQPKCRDCQQSIAWFNVLGVGRRPFEPKPVDPASTGRPAYPVEGGALAWSLRDLVEDLMVRREISHDEADEEARAMPFHVRHICPNAPDRTDMQETHA
jgi:hypothetical protein